jgi:hypothetical protein
VAGPHCQQETILEGRQHLRPGWKEALEFNREDARAAARQGYEEETLLV